MPAGPSVSVRVVKPSRSEKSTVASDCTGARSPPSVSSVFATSVGTKRPSVSRISSRSRSPAAIRLNDRFASSNSATRLGGSARTRSKRSASMERAAAASALTGRLTRTPSHAARATETTSTASPAKGRGDQTFELVAFAGPLACVVPTQGGPDNPDEPFDDVARPGIHVDPDGPRRRAVAKDVPVQEHVVVVTHRHPRCAHPGHAAEEEQLRIVGGPDTLEHGVPDGIEGGEGLVLAGGVGRPVDQQRMGEDVFVIVEDERNDPGPGAHRCEVP